MKCDYCDIYNTEEVLKGYDGIVYNKSVKQYYIFAEHYEGETVRIPVQFCPQCGRKLSE